MSEGASHDLTIGRAEYLKAARPLTHLLRRKDLTDAILSLEGENLCVSLVGMAVYARAEGSWPGEVRVPGLFVVGLAKLPPPDDPLRFRVQDGRLRVGPLSVACVAQEAWKSEVPLPLDPSLPEILKLSFQFPADRLERAGLMRRVEEANTRAAKLLDQAAKTLAPLGISRQDLRDFLVRRLKE